MNKNIGWTIMFALKDIENISFFIMKGFWNPTKQHKNDLIDRIEKLLEQAKKIQTVD